MKKVTIITFWSDVAQAHLRQIKKLFGSKIDVSTISYDIETINSTIHADLIVISLYSIYVSLKKYINDESQIVIINPTINIEQYNQIMCIPAGEKVMLVNYSSEMTMETMALFSQLGINHIEFSPVYPGIMNVPNLKTALTPGEAQHVPSGVENVIDIGHRVLDAGTIVEIAVKLGMDYLLQEDRFIDYFGSVKTHRLGLHMLLGKTSTLESELVSLLNVLDDGIIGVDANGLVHALNKRAESIIGCKKESAIGENIKNIVPQLPFDQVINTSQAIRATLIKINDCDISTTIVPVIVAKKTTGALAIINEFTEQEKNQHRLRLQLIGKGHKAKYRFEDIQGQDPAMLELKSMAQRMARSDSSVLISGESGTGKELFAQAIHNASKRKEYQFVAVNCAALPDSLLESELFGYEEGSFTGAKKGGKLGLFELAHKGTLFLDEIGEMALNLQARLLRVIQEREVMRIGGDRVITIDIRIIAASNKELKQLVEQGKFRKDLYYRLSVLPLETIPLRKRRGDILLLIKHIKKELRLDFTLTEQAMRAFENHVWDGNVRELRNSMEYLAHLDKQVIDVIDIPFARKSIHRTTEADNLYNECVNSVVGSGKYSKEQYMFVLECLGNSMVTRRRIGRRSIVDLAEACQFYLSENEVRGILHELQAKRLVKLCNGRGGTQITELGLQCIKNAKPGLLG